MKYFILTLLSLVTFDLTAQVSGSYFLKETDSKDPIEGAIIQYGEKQNDYVLSDKNGVFSIPEKRNNIIYIRCLGYSTKSFLYEELRQTKIVYLDSSPFELNAIEITPADVNGILSEAIANTKRKLLEGSYSNYLLHIKQLEEYSGEEQEIKLRYIARLDKVKGKKLSFTLKENDIKKMKLLSENATSHFLKKNMFNVEYHIQTFDSDYYLDKYKITKSDSSNDLLVLSAFPKKSDKTSFVDYKFYINKTDTTLQTISIDLDMKNTEGGYKSFGTRKYKINKKRTVINFSKNKEGKYIFAKGLQILEILVEYKNGHKEKIISYSNCKLEETNNLRPENFDSLHKLNGYSKEIFSR